MTYWLDIIGIGEDGLDSLTATASAALEQAEVVIGGNRHHGLAPHLQAKRVKWPEPFSKIIGTVEQYRGSRVAVLVTGDPLWFSAGARVARQLPAEEVRFHPQLSAFQYACCRMHWSLADIETLTAHGRPPEQIVPWFAPNARLAVLTTGSNDPGAIARLLVKNGYGPSRMTVLAALGGPKEQRIAGVADYWATSDPKDRIPVFHTLCIECRLAVGAMPLARGPGLPDHAFETDGNFTKQEIRAVTVSVLAPRRGALLWDIGTGCGTVAIEWMRAATDARAIGIDPNVSRLEMARKNSRELGVPRLQLVRGRAPKALADLPAPDAIFIGGGLTKSLIAKSVAALEPCGRIVANAVTINGEAILARAHAEHGGELVRMSVARAVEIGSKSGWRQMMPVTQWRLTK